MSVVDDERKCSLKIPFNLTENTHMYAHTIFHRQSECM